MGAGLNVCFEGRYFLGPPTYPFYVCVLNVYYFGHRIKIYLRTKLGAPMMTGLYYLSLDANGTAGLFWEEWVGLFYKDESYPVERVWKTLFFIRGSNADQKITQYDSTKQHYPP